jgi:rfaE bifunctional protein kinase chain/domain
MELKPPNKVDILVIGDIMLDRYILSEVTRISPEAPVPVAKVVDEYETIGGSGNVLRNLKALGIRTFSIGAVGADDAGERISQQVGEGITIVEPKMETMQKIRVVSSGTETQMIRVDKERGSINVTEDTILNIAVRNTKCYDLVIVSDYGKGMISPLTMSFVKNLRTPILLDPKPTNEKLYSDIFMMTPNTEEYTKMGFDRRKSKKRNIQYTLITMGAGGMMFVDNTKKRTKTKHIPTSPVEVFNVTGAGDVVISVVGACLAMGMDPFNASLIANRCANFAVTKKGTCIVDKLLFKESINELLKK